MNKINLIAGIFCIAFSISRLMNNDMFGFTIDAFLGILNLALYLW